MAVAMGVGAAVAGFGGTAWADDTTDGTTDSGSAQTSGPSNRTSTNATVGSVGQTAADPPATNPASPKLNQRDLHLPRVIVRSSGGLT
ncbi:MAG: hypothetical protein WAM92_19535, partial [Mycobacterium sp.]